MYLSCHLLEGAIAFETRELSNAERVFRRVCKHGDMASSPMWIARGSQALGNCLIETGSLDEAAECLMTALRLFRDMQNLIEETRCRWGLARISQKDGRPESAITHLKAVREEFRLNGITTDAALVTVDLMESYLVLRSWREVRVAAGDVVALFEKAGMLTGALTAANWLRHAARMKAITPSILDVVRWYFKRLRVQPDLTFAPPTGL